MLKFILYDYTQPVFSGRNIENLLNDSIRKMWLVQNQTLIATHLYGRKIFKNYEAKMNENSQLLYNKLVKNKSIPEIKQDDDKELI